MKQRQSTGPGEGTNRGNDNFTGREIAVIGMAGRFPGAKNIEEFWNNLKTGKETITFFPGKELEEAGIDPGLIENPNYVKAKPQLQDKDCFDAAFFGYTPREAEAMAPHIRLFYECAWTALENSGYGPFTYKGMIGCYAGANSSFDWQLLSIVSGKNSHLGDWNAGLLSDKDTLSTQLAYKLDLKGPCFTLYTACSTSLLAIHLACRALLTGECGIALAGGAAVFTSDKPGYLFREGMLFSADGHCRTLDARASGTIFGEGVGAVVLKRLGQALKDGDYIHAVIKGSAVVNDGTGRVGYTAPGTLGEREVVKLAHRVAGVSSESIGYVEIHGTGTILGDPVEMDALIQAFKTDKRHFCAVGSVKTNIGHLDAAAGVTGFIKTVLALKHRLIPPSLHFETSNPRIDFENSPFYVNTRLTRWESDGNPLRAGISAFGIGGTNAHVVLEEWPGDSESGRGGSLCPPEKSRDYQLILLSAKTQSALDKMTENLAEYLKQNLLNRGNHENPTNPGPTLADAAYTLQVGRQVFSHRRMLVCSKVEEAIEALSNPGSSKMNTFIPEAEHQNPPVVFMFPGLGPEYVNMGRELYEKEPIFRREMDRCFEILKPLTGHDIKELLYPGERKAQSAERKAQSWPGSPPSEHTPLEERHAPSAVRHAINQIEIAQPVLFIFQYALAQLLMHWGITPYAMIGYSFGEYAAACISGVFSLEDAIKVVTTRGELIEQTPPGALLSVPLSREAIAAILPPQLSLAIDNDASCLVGGPLEAVQAFEKQMKEKKIMCMRLQTSKAVHSSTMEPILKKFTGKIKEVNRSTPKIPYISNVSGTWVTESQALDPAYWSVHLRETVWFADGIKKLVERKKNTLFIEVGPGRDLSTLVWRYLENNPGQQVINLVRHPQQELTDVYYLMSKIGRMWLYGKKPDWQGFYSHENRQRIPVPTYPFEVNACHYPAQGDPFMIARKMLVARSPLSKKENIADWFYQPSWKRLKQVREVENRTRDKGCWLIFIADQPNTPSLCTRLVKQLNKEYENENQGVITAAIGSEFGKINARSYTINPGNPGHYFALLNELRSANLIPGKILHLWNITGKNGVPAPSSAGLNRADPEHTLETGFYSLLYLAQAMGKAGFINSCEITVISDNMQEVAEDPYHSPGKMTLLAPVNVIPQEYPHIKCRSIDIIIPSTGGREQETLVDALTAEVKTNISDTVVAFRGNHRWVRTFEPIPLKDTTPGSLRLRKGGIYLITGGLGSIGLVLAEGLFKSVGAKLVLTTRTPLPPRQEWSHWLETHGNDSQHKVSHRIRKIRELENQGARVLVLEADAADEEGMRTVITCAEERFGKINGVIHAAGIVGGPSMKTIAQTTQHHCRRQFHPKVYGTLVLEKVLEDKKLDFCLLMSSISSVLGGVGYIAYSAANLFMDAFVLCHNRTHTQPWISINWDEWKLPGQEAQQSGVGASLARLAMTPKQGFNAFKRLISQETFHQVAISTGNLQTRIDQWIKLESLKTGEKIQQTSSTSAPVQARPPLVSPYVPPGNPTEKTIAEIFQNMFGYKQIGVEDDFFELGGDSLKAITMISLINKALNVTVPLPEFFNRPTIKKLIEYIENTETTIYSSIEPVEKKEYYSLSSAQKRMYILHQMNPETVGYNLAATMLLQGEVDIARLDRTFRRLIRRHESLRTSCPMMENKPVQRIHDDVEFEIEYYDFKVTSAGDERRWEQVPIGQDLNAPGEIIQAEAETHHSSFSIQHSFIRPFDLSRAPLLRVGLIKLEQQKHLLIVDMHHIIHDGISQTILLKDFMAFYSGELLPVLTLQYKDYSEWKKGYTEKEAIKKQQDYWLNEFTGNIPVLDLPCDYDRPAIQSFEGHTKGFEISMEETRELRALALSENATLFMVLLSLYNVFLSRLSGLEDIVVGTPVAGRKHPDLQSIIGFFLNTLSLRNYPAGNKPFRAFLKEIKENTLKAFGNQDYPFEDLVERVGVNRDLSRNPLFDVMLILHNQWNPQPGQVALQNKSKLKWSTYPNEKGTSEFDLTLIGFEGENRLVFNVEYSAKLFKKETIQRFIIYFKTIVSAVVDNPEQAIAWLEIMPQAEKQQLLHDFNDTAAAYPTHKTIQRLFREQAAETPGYIAAAGHVQLSYRELNERSGQLAHLLKTKGVRPGTIVALLVERSIEMIVGILGILKAGGAYLPIDPEHPEERIKYMLTDAKVKYLVKNGKNISDSVIWGDIHIISIDDFFSKIRSQDTAFHLHLSPSINAPVTSLAYVIYTSGSTGNPKGVVIRHQNTVNFIKGMTSLIDFSPGKTILAITTISFDIFFLEVLLPVTCGLKVLVADENQQRDPALLRNVILVHQVDILQMTPSRLQLLLKSGDDLAFLEGAAALIVGGEALPGLLFERVKKEFPGKFYNVYGPTETTIWSTVKDLSNCQPGELTIGGPIANTQVYIVDRYTRLVPVMVPGQLLLGGDGVAAGYLNNPELTAEKFKRAVISHSSLVTSSPYKLSPNDRSHKLFPNDQCPMTNDRFYRTGDLARWLPWGEIEFLGRIDHQVKIRGFRIELEEIQEQLVNHDYIEEAVVISRENSKGDKYLCAYFVVGAGHHVPAADQLREYLSRRLPDYMLPGFFVSLEKIPLTPNGKIDRKSLPEPSSTRPQLKESYTHPRTEMEKKIAAVWKEVLELEQIGIDDSFFDLGGNSMGLVTITNRLRKELEKDIPVVSMFRYRTIRSLAVVLDREEAIEMARKDRTEALSKGEMRKKKKLQARKRDIK